MGLPMIIATTSKNKQFLNGKEISHGVGDTIAKVTKAVGIKPCGGCKKRQKAINEADKMVRKVVHKIKTRMMT